MSSVYFKPVSYTHLDVYKRQIIFTVTKPFYNHKRTKKISSDVTDRGGFPHPLGSTPTIFSSLLLIHIFFAVLYVKYQFW